MPRPALPVLAGLMAGLLFLTANIWALHNPQPHHAPIAVAADAVAVQQALDKGTPGGYEVFHDPAPEQAVRERRAYAGVGEDRTIYYASANGTAAGKNLSQQLSITLRGTASDVVSLQPQDPSGLSLSQIVLGSIIGGFLMGVLTAQLALGEPLWQRGLAYVAFAVAFGGLAALVIDPIIGVLTGHFFVVWAWISATAFTLSVSVGALARVAGQPGIPLAMLAFLIIGNPSAGAFAPSEYLPWLFRTVGPYLPPNALGTGLIGTTYFDAGVLRPILVLVAWALAAVLALVFLDRSHGSRRALAYDAAAAAGDREDRATG